MKETYFWTDTQKKLLSLRPNKDNYNIKKYIEKIIFNHLLIVKGVVNEQKDYLLEKDLNITFVKYILNTNSESYGDNINKYNVGYYHTELAKQFNKIALKNNLSRNELWNKVKLNILCKNFNKTELRLYKYIIRGEVIPSPLYVYKTLQRYEDLPSFLFIVYLDEEISPELKEAYKKITT